MAVVMVGVMAILAQTASFERFLSSSLRKLASSLQSALAQYR
jgi:hypothetical protein